MKVSTGTSRFISSVLPETSWQRAASSDFSKQTKLQRKTDKRQAARLKAEPQTDMTSDYYLKDE